MKKSIGLSMLVLALCFPIVAQSIPKSSKLTVVNQKNENLSASEASWLSGAVRDKLESNLMTYTDFSFVTADISAVQKLQKQSESAVYNENDAIELGKMVSAKFAVFITIRKSNSNYSMTADVTDLTTGQKRATAVSSPRKSAESLCHGTGCAVDEITTKLCEQLGIKLSASQKYTLARGEENLSTEEQRKMAAEETKIYEDSIRKMDAELKRLSASTDLTSTAEKARIEAEKALAQEKLKAAQEKEKRLEEEAKKIAADKAEDAARSEEQKRKRDQMAKEVEAKAATVRKTAFENESVFTKISVIESKKKAIVDIQKSVDDRIAEIKKDGDEEFAKKKAEIENAPYRAAEKNEDGTPSSTAKERRKKQIDDLKKEIDGRVAKESEDVKSSAVDSVYALYEEIKNDQQNLSQSKTVTSFDDDLKVQINTFNGKTNAWKVTFWLYSNGMPVTSQSVDMTYRDLAGKEIDTSSSKEYDDFIDFVDLYNSLFSRGSPILTFNLKYKIESVDDFDSNYKITLEGLDVKDTSITSFKCLD